MKIAVVGAGAMGCLFGGLLARAGEEVVLLDRSAETLEALARRGVVLHEGEGRETIPVAAAGDPRDAGACDGVLVFVKAHQTLSARPSVAALAQGGAWVLTLQNGLGAADLLAEVVAPGRLLVGVTAQGATLLGPAEVRHGGAGPTVLGPYLPGPSPEAGAAARVLAGAGLECRAVEDPWPHVWHKLAVNCGINALTALTGIRNGRIPEIPPAAALLEEAVGEAAAVARAAGVDLGDPKALARRVLDVARATAANRSSMGQDVDRRASTEVAFINGAVAREGERRGVATPVNRTLTRLIQTLEATFGADTPGST
ncbi:MAG: 2-dehydropantoate 2-reductase [Deferrisomatales bacterium]